MGRIGTAVGGVVAVGAGVLVGARVEVAVRVGVMVGATPIALGSSSSTARAPSTSPPMTMTTPITPQGRRRITPRMNRPKVGRGAASAGAGGELSSRGAMSTMTGSDSWPQIGQMARSAAIFELQEGHRRVVLPAIVCMRVVRRASGHPDPGSRRWPAWRQARSQCAHQEARRAPGSPLQSPPDAHPRQSPSPSTFS